MVQRAGYEETEQELIFRFEVPEILKNHLVIRVTEDIIYLHLDNKHTTQVLDDDFLKEEESFTAVSKEILLPKKVNPKLTKTSYKEGIFEVVMKKAG
jgi:HSP20 family molecular chaperone IbpA